MAATTMAHTRNRTVHEQANDVVHERAVGDTVIVQVRQEEKEVRTRAPATATSTAATANGAAIAAPVVPFASISPHLFTPPPRQTHVVPKQWDVTRYMSVLRTKGCRNVKQRILVKQRITTEAFVKRLMPTNPQQ